MTDLTISLKKPPKVLLIGNGLCRAAGDSSCDELIDDIRMRYSPEKTMESLERLSFPMRVVAASKDHVNECMKSVAKQMCKAELCEEGKNLFSELLSIRPEALLTTNYSYEIEKTVYGNFSKYKYGKIRKNTYPKETGNIQNKRIYQYHDLSETGYEFPIWHIHGEAHCPSSMVSGQDRIHPLIVEIKRAEKSGNPFIHAKSWIDYFLLGDVHVIGFSWDISEIDLWWLTACKKEHFSQNGTIHFYDPKKEKILKSAEKIMMDVYGVETVCPDEFDGDYAWYYRNRVEELRRKR